MIAAAFAGAPLCACVLDARGRVVEANALFEEQVGAKYKFAGYAFEHVGAEEAEVVRLREALDGARESGRRRKVRDVKCLVLGDGFPVAKHFDWSVSSLDCEGGLCLVGELVTEVDGQQREKDAELLDFFQNAPIAMHWLSADGIILWANNTELRVLGYTAEEYIGQPIMKFCPDETEMVLEIFKTLGSGASIKDVPVQFLAKDGRVVPLLIDSNVNYTKSGDFNHTRCFIRDDTGRKVKEARAELMVQELKRSAELFDAFVSRTLHQVRTPCHVVLADLDRLQHGDVPRGEARDALREASQLLEHMIGMTSDVSDLMRFEQGASLKVRRTGVDLNELGRAAVDLAQPLVRAGVDLAFDFSEGGGFLQTDDLVLIRILTHLLKNSAAATAQGRIVLRVAHVATGVTISVEDSGKGLDMTDLQFSQRYSADLRAVEEMTLEAALSARSKLEADLLLDSGNEGLGIGLSLSYLLVHSLGGELQGESVLGQGTRFWFHLPRDADERGADAPAQVYRPAHYDSKALPNPLAVGAVGATAAAAGGAPAPRVAVPSWGLSARRSLSDFEATAAPVLSQNAVTGKFTYQAAKADVVRITQCGVFEATKVPHVLIVEDSPLCAKVLSKMLARAGCTSDVVGDGARAVAALGAAAGDYDLVLMDLRMPVMDGFEATRIAKQNLGVAIPIVAVTAESSFETQERCVDVGFDDFSPKPIKLQALLKLLEKHLTGLVAPPCAGLAAATCV
ncbi:hypothetical protein M885DRAFT_476303 [Pelagophyceae sp. CCMP2097]|nr:hypothetical protein M885DRAFT_476303 [Pelagophyceae sp. CCMP2097]